MTFAQTLRKIRTEAELSIPLLSARSTISTQQLYSFERGGSIPNFVTMVKLAKSLNVSTSVFEDCLFPQRERVAVINN